MTAYQEEFQRSLADPSSYWLERAGDVHWYKTPQQGIDISRSPYNNWFADCAIKVCYNALDVHVENARADQPALIHDSPVTESHTTLTYSQLLDQVALAAGVLESAGVTKGDRVMIGPVAAFKMVAVVDKLPKTRSGKILRGTMRSIADRTDWNMPATIEDPSVLEDIKQSLRSLGLVKAHS